MFDEGDVEFGEFVFGVDVGEFEELGGVEGVVGDDDFVGGEDLGFGGGLVVVFGVCFVEGLVLYYFDVDGMGGDV